MTQESTIRWTACSEGMPERTEWYLCTRNDDYVPVTMYLFDATRKRWMAGDFSPAQPIAWAPMPKPYRAEGERK